MPTDNHTPQRSSSLTEIIRISQILGLYDEDDSADDQESDDRKN